MESLLICIHWVKFFHFFLCVFTWNRPGTIRKFKLPCSLWLVSMEIRPKGIFISIWHLHVQIKNHKENTRTKRETSEAYSEPCQTSKMKIFVKILNGFQLLSILSNHYTQRCIQNPVKNLRWSFLRKELPILATNNFRK